MARTSRIAAAVAAILLLAGVLSGCAYVRAAQTDTFAAVNAIAEELDVDALGTATSMKYSGTKDDSARPPTLRIVISGGDVVANAEARLANAGFETESIQDPTFHYWERGDERVIVELFTRVEAVGSPVDETDDQPVTTALRDDLIAISIVAYPQP